MDKMFEFYYSCKVDENIIGAPKMQNNLVQFFASFLDFALFIAVALNDNNDKFSFTFCYRLWEKEEAITIAMESNKEKKLWQKLENDTEIEAKWLRVKTFDNAKLEEW